MQRAEQIMSQAATKEEYDQFNDDIDDDELCRVNRFIKFPEILLNTYIFRRVMNVMNYIMLHRQYNLNNKNYVTLNKLTI